MVSTEEMSAHAWTVRVQRRIDTILLIHFAVSVHVPANCQLPSVARLANQALFHMGNKAPVLLLPRDVTKSLKCNTRRLTSRYTTLYCPNNRGLFVDSYLYCENRESLVENLSACGSCDVVLMQCYHCLVAMATLQEHYSFIYHCLLEWLKEEE